MNTTEAAKQLGIPPKELRRILRSSLDNFGVKKVEDKWYFKKGDIARIRAHIAKNAKPANPPKEYDAEKELTERQLRVLSRRDPKLNKEVTQRYIARVNRLEELLRARGMHISQQEK